MPPRPWKWMLTPAAFALGFALLAVSGWTIANFLPARARANDFSHAYLASRARAQGLDPYVKPPADFAREQGLDFEQFWPQATNPPLLVWALQPLGRLSPQPAFWIFVGVQALSLVAICWMIRRQFTWRGWALAAGLVCCSMPVFTHFWFTQVQLPLVALALAGAFALRRGWTVAACALLTLVAALKLYPAPLVLLPALSVSGRQRWRVLGWTALCALVWLLLPGVPAWISFFQHSLPSLEQLAEGRHYNFTVASFLTGLCGVKWPGVVASVALILCAWWRVARRPDNFEANLCLLLVTTVMCSMIAWVHYFVWLIYPVSVLAGQRRWVWVVLALILFNAAGSNPLDLTGVAKLLNASAPLSMMAGLYVHFARLRGAEAATAAQARAK